MKKMTSFMSVAVLAATLNCAAWAQNVRSTPDDQEKLRVAEQIVTLTGPADAMAQLVTNMMAPARQTLADEIKQKNPQLEALQLKRAVDLHSEALDKASRQYMAEVLPVMFKSLAQAYANKFSLAELGAIFQYQASDVGRKAQLFTLNGIPELMKPATASAQKMGADIREAFAKVRRQLAQEGIALK